MQATHTNQQNTLLRDERQGLNRLRLYELAEPRKLWSKGQAVRYAVEYLWYNANGGVQGDETAYFTRSEGQSMIAARSLFDVVNLF